MNFKLPTIEKNKQPAQEEEYNFVNTKQRRKTKDVSTPPLGLLDDLKRRIQQQKRQIETRNNAIMALQRNFQSMAALVKAEKAENSQLKDELDKFKKLAEDNGKKAVDYHQKSIQTNNENKKLQAEIQKLKDLNSNLANENKILQVHLRTIQNLEKKNKKLEQRINDLESNKQQLINQIRLLSDVEKQKAQYQDVIKKLRNDLKQMTGQRDVIGLKMMKLEQEKQVLDSSVKRLEDYVQTLKKKNLDDKSKQFEANQQIGKLKNKILCLEQDLMKTRVQAENKDVIIMMKVQTEQQLKTNMVQLKMKLGQNQSDLFQKTSEAQQKKRILQKLEGDYNILNEKFALEKVKNKQLQEQSTKSHDKDQHLSILAQQMNNIKKNNIILQQKYNSVKQQLIQKQSFISKYDKYFQQIDRFSPVRIISQAEYERLASSIVELQKNKGNTTNQVDELNKKLKNQEKELIKMSKELEEYKKEQDQLKKILGNQKYAMEKLQKQKLIKDQQIQKQRQNNKLLWSDNKKLKQKQKLIEIIENQKLQLAIKSQSDLQKLERMKDIEMKENQMKLKAEYQKQFELLQNSNNDQVSNILKKKTEYIKQLQDKMNKFFEQVEFYKGRYKQLEGVASRSQKKISEMEINYAESMNNQQNEYERISNEHKSCALNMKTLTQRLSSLQKIKKQHTLLCQQNKKLIQKLSSFQSEYQKAKKKLQIFQSQDFNKKRETLDNKIKMLLKSVADLYESLIAIKNHLSCSHCCELPVETIKLIPCGHVFCKKCKQGYEQVCQECKRSGSAVADKQHDQTIVKLNYMQMILMSVKEETHILSKL